MKDIKNYEILMKEIEPNTNKLKDFLYLWIQRFSILDCPLEKAMAPHSSTLAWKIPWTKDPGRLQSMGWLRVGHDWATSFSLFTFMHWRRKWQPTPVFLPGNPRDGGAWWASAYGVALSRTWLKLLRSSSSSMKLNVSAGLLDIYYRYHNCLWESFTFV